MKVAFEPIYIEISAEIKSRNKGGTAEYIRPLIRADFFYYEERIIYKSGGLLMKKNLDKNYNPQSFEDRIYKKWEESGAFIANNKSDKKPYTIIMPPPNITGQLHMGHALDQTLQDVLIRYKRMTGYEALWIPGTDHASIATEVKVIEKLREEGINKEDLGREKFLEHVWAWKDKYGNEITKQNRKLGDSCDWSRECFTMDEQRSKSVVEFFVRLYEKGYIYKSNRLINWCPVCKTTLSDAEVEHEDAHGHYWHVRYPMVDGDGFIEIATSRPETIFGDVAIAVHPDDERYKDKIGKLVRVPIVDREIPIIADTYPDMTKGTGAVKITPASDFNDFEVGKRHDLDSIDIMDLEAKMTSITGKYAGMDRYECREKFVKELDEKGFLVKIEDVEIPAGTCYRCHNVIEPMLSDQWFVAMEKLAKPAIEAAKNGDLTHVPKRFEKIYLHWLENIRDWNISRQLWWGHRIPAYYCEHCEQIIVDRGEVRECPYCGSVKLRQEEDVLDTWFSSALWPFSTLGWPDKTDDYEFFYPTDVLVTGYDIIFFWVVRMVFSALEMTDVLPFKDVYIHGLVRDEQGRKMSKSLGNGVNPLDVIAEYGADALRYMLISGITPGNDTRYMTEKVVAARNFANKLWNASKFVIMSLYDDDGNLLPQRENQEFWKEEDKWIISRINEAHKAFEEYFEKYELGLAAQKVYDLIWNEYCDWYIEMIKSRLYGSDEEDKQTLRYILHTTLESLLKLLHPFMPFITEEIYGILNEDAGFIMLEQIDAYDEKYVFEEDVTMISLIMDIVKAVRNIRAEADTKPSKKIKAFIIGEDKELEYVKKGERFIKALCGIDNLSLLRDDTEVKDGDFMSAVVKGVEIRIPLDELVDIEVELERLKKERTRLEGEVARGEKLLSNQGFVAKAPKEKIAQEEEKLADYRVSLEKVCQRLSDLENK